MADSTSKSYSLDPMLYLYTSLTAGSSHIVTATSRLETILKANRIPFKGIDIATDEKARMLWGRRAGKDESGRQRKLPGLVQMGLVIGDLVEIEEWNEYGELKQHVKIVNDGTAITVPPAINTTPAATKPPVAAAPKADAKKTEPPAPLQTKPVTKSPEPSAEPADDGTASLTAAMRQLGQEAANKAKEAKSKPIKAYVGKGQADAAAKSPEIAATPETKGSQLDTLLQSPTSTSWKAASHRERDAGEQFGSVQSPTSTAWKPTDYDPPVTSHRGSSVSDASPEVIKKIEDEEAIPEADEEDEEDEEEEDDDEEDDDEDDDDEDDEEEDDEEEDDDEDDDDDEEEEEDDDEEEEEEQTKAVKKKA